MSEIYNQLIDKPDSNCNWGGRGMVSTHDLALSAERQHHNNLYQKDEHEIHHGLSDQDLRILHKIIARDYPTDTGVGRKRGAILRYIKYFKETQHTPPKVNGKVLYKYLKRNV